MKQILLTFLFTASCLLPAMVVGQGVTTASMSGVVSSSDGTTLPGANVIAVHQPSGTQYGVATRGDGSFTIPAMRVGGPYRVTVSFVGYETRIFDGIDLRLGQNFTLNAILTDEGQTLDAVEVVGRRNPVLNSERTGAATNISNEAINSLPTISRSIDDFTRLTPQSSGRSFGGQDARFNNLTIDGSIFNNSFGLSSTPGGQTRSTPISLDAIEQIQVNLAPYDVRQGGFTGAGINAITRQGNNDFSGSVFYNFRSERFVGKEARGTEVVTDVFDVKQYGFRLGGPIIKNKLFFFVNGESERRTDPATPFIAAAPGREGNNVTRVQKAELDQLRSFLIERYGYDPGEYEGYPLETQSDKILARLDWNINNNHKFSLRYNQLKSFTDVLASQSGAFNGRRSNLFALNFQASNYIIHNDIYSIIGELNSTFGNKFSNNFIAGYTANRDYRDSRGGIFPLVDILQDGRNYTTFGYEPFTPNNRLDTDTWQAQNNFTAYLTGHTITAGVNFESFTFGNTFTPNYYGRYVFNSLDEFYRAANGENVTYRQFEQTYSALPGGALPTATTEAYQVGAYIQDEIEPFQNFKVTAGLRIDVPFFGNTALNNPAVEQLSFRNPEGETQRFSTSKLPDAHILWSPRVGLNWDVLGDRSLQVRGGTGLFSGRPAFVWVSNQVGNNGVLTGSNRVNNPTTGGDDPTVTYYPFTGAIDNNIPANPTLPSTIGLAFVDNDFRFPQVWRSNLAIDKELPGNIVATLEGIYNHSVYNVFYYNANQTTSVGNMVGPDSRPVYAGNDAGNRINSNITDATVLTNYQGGYSYSITGQLQKTFEGGLYAMVAYNFGEAKDIQSAGSQAFSSFRDNRTVRGNNYPDLAFSENDQRHRLISSLSYRKEYLKNTASQVSLFYELRNQGRFSYTYSGDANGDQLFGNDLIYVPTSEELQNMAFLPLSTGGATYSEDAQRNYFETLIQQNEYLRSRRGMYAERNGAILPWVGQLDLSFQQEFFVNVGGKRNTLQLRADIINFGNMLNNNWGVSQFATNASPLRVASLTEGETAGQYTPTYQLNTTSGVLRTDSYRYGSGIGDVWQMQLGVRYTFN
ncbi:TonB-dependent receptor [Cesiribacter andamanensis]|uniref:TonB-dependent transporter Oar-like beta-barrel domain-containing protein n=1 Tax=Cesiribacter andamanensis AMV16 TaxID=1279009 RepID=M7MYQ6_9BACT|nr:carboxypeptidase regulatory-like domain-containing protein [Cesiribacter andamanensis]EMR01593.1 hypothetical protein ADICEAN_03271 [Cesiribacter andamanensis AMV16]